MFINARGFDHSGKKRTQALEWMRRCTKPRCFKWDSLVGVSYKLLTDILVHTHLGLTFILRHLKDYLHHNDAVVELASRKSTLEPESPAEIHLMEPEWGGCFTQISHTCHFPLVVSSHADHFSVIARVTCLLHFSHRNTTEIK